VIGETGNESPFDFLTLIPWGLSADTFSLAVVVKKLFEALDLTGKLVSAGKKYIF
jgi:hypothetical protein